MSQKRDAAYGFPFQLEDSALGNYPSAPVARAMLKRSISCEYKASAAHQNNHQIMTHLLPSRNEHAAACKLRFPEPEISEERLYSPFAEPPDQKQGTQFEILRDPSSTGAEDGKTGSVVSMPPGKANKVLTDRFRCPEDVAHSTVTAGLSSESGVFRFDFDANSSAGNPATGVGDPLHNTFQQVRAHTSTAQLPFDPLRAVDSLLWERYAARSARAGKPLVTNNVVRNVYYAVRPFLPVAVRKQFQKMYFRGWEKVRFPTWPVDRTVENILEQLLVGAMKSLNICSVPFIWFWPDGARSCAMMTHDVETLAGANFCSELMDLDDSFGIKSSFQVVPEERYPVTSRYLESIRRRGFEVNVHDLNHDGQLFRERTEFLRRAERIRFYAQQFGAQGFRSAVLYRNVDWYDALDFSYDMSIPNVAHLDPQPGGCCTVMPFFLGKILELPVTTTQDYTLFHILNDYSIRLWKQQISLIREKHGLISFIIHPDYVIEKAARRVYADLLRYLAEMRALGETWIALPGDVAAWWRLRSEMKLVEAGGSWRIEGQGHERARIAYAKIVNNELVYAMEPAE
jgi:hypothetical protein